MKGGRGSRRERLKQQGAEGMALYRLKVRMEEAANEFYQVEVLTRQQWVELAAAVGVHVETVKGYVLHEGGIKPIHMANFARAVNKPLTWFYEDLTGAEPSAAERLLGATVQRFMEGQPLSAATQSQLGQPLSGPARRALDEDEAKLREAFSVLFPDWQDLSPRQVDQRLAALRLLWGRLAAGEE